jgi:RNA polymerase sigma-B factor
MHKHLPPSSSEPKPAAREDRRLLLRYHRDGDRRARDELVERFMPLARQLARRYQRGPEPLEDLVQVASVGLVKAIDRFDPARTTAFSSYAVPTMVGELKRYFRDFGWAVHVPRGMQERTVAVQSTVTRLSKELGRSPSATEVGEILDLNEEQVLEALEAAGAYRATSFDAPRSSDEDSGDSLADAFGDEESGFGLAEDRATLERLMAAITPREREVLRLRFVEDLTQAEIGARIGVSQMQVSRLIRQSLARLRTAALAAERQAMRDR